MAVLVFHNAALRTLGSPTTELSSIHSFLYLDHNRILTHEVFAMSGNLRFKWFQRSMILPSFFHDLFFLSMYLSDLEEAKKERKEETKI